MTSSTHLVVVIDAIPPIKLLERQENLYEIWLDSIIAFSNSHLLMSSKNNLTVIASHLDNNELIYPSADSVRLPAPNGQHELFAQVAEVISKEMKRLSAKAAADVADAVEKKRKFPESRMAGAVSLGLCRINKLKADYDASRMAIISASTDSSIFYASQYMNFMNAFFTAQKMGVAIDVCVAAIGQANGQGGPSILQQGSEITEGLYIAIPNVTAFLEYLLWILLPDKDIRDKMVLPQQKSLGFKAACFCHRSLVDVAYVCSVCLSVFCSFSPICSTCQTIFKLGPMPLAKGKRKATPKK
ncbi:General transcription factor IIH subunit 3 [Halotydeus destructor]|nr:General transcription factor IIH subunit 3 [Halotydeus destructor]